MESSATLPVICIVIVLVVEFRRAATNRSDSQRVDAAIRSGTPRSCSRALRATLSRVGKFAAIRKRHFPFLKLGQFNGAEQTNELSHKYSVEFRVTTLFHRRRRARV